MSFSHVLARARSLGGVVFPPSAASPHQAPGRAWPGLTPSPLEGVPVTAAKASPGGSNKQFSTFAALGLAVGLWPRLRCGPVGGWASHTWQTGKHPGEESWLSRGSVRAPGGSASAFQEGKLSLRALALPEATCSLRLPQGGRRLCGGVRRHSRRGRPRLGELCHCKVTCTSVADL